MKSPRKTLASLLGVAAATFMAAGAAQSATLVDTELQLLVDVSGSIDSTEFALQRQGYSDAFRDAAIQATMFDTDGGNRYGKMAAQLIYWSSAAEQIIAVGWSLLEDAASAIAFADAIDAAPRTFAGLTAPGSALNFGAGLFATNDFDGTTNVIDVSGDGPQNDGATTATARDAALAAGVDRINGLAILDGDASLLPWYQANIQGGPNSFSLAALDFVDFSNAIKTKIAFEAGGGMPPVPLPATALLLMGGIAGLGAAAKRRKAAAA